MAILLGDQEWEARERFGAGFIRRQHPQVVRKLPMYFRDSGLYDMDAAISNMAALEWLMTPEASGFYHIKEEPLMEVLPDFAIVTFTSDGEMIDEPTKIGEIVTYTFTDPATAFMFRLKFS